MPAQGTPRELGPISEQVLAWVADMRANPLIRGTDGPGLRWPTLDELRRIELCALATREAAMFFDLYGIGDPDAAAAEVQDERRAPGRLPEAEGCCDGCDGSCDAFR